MTHVNRYIIKVPSQSATTATTISIPVNMDFQLVDQCEVVEREFVNIELQNSVNPILDYEKARYGPTVPDTYNPVNNLVDSILYRVNFLNDTGTYNVNTFYSDIGFSDNDILFRKNSFTKSFLTLNFYDTDIGTDQRLLLFATLFSKITNSDYGPDGILSNANQFAVHYKLSNPLIDRVNNGEGYFLYYYKDEVFELIPRELYMRATFNNAKTGKATNFMSTNNTALTIEELVGTTMGTTNKNNLYTRYLLKRNNNGYFYELDTTYSNNIAVMGNNYCIDLYQITAI